MIVNPLPLEQLPQEGAPSWSNHVFKILLLQVSVSLHLVGDIQTTVLVFPGCCPESSRCLLLVIEVSRFLFKRALTF